MTENKSQHTIKAMIIDDEPLACSLLQLMLEKCTQIELIKVEHHPKKAIDCINELKPDLIFLDIQMPQITGIELLEIIDHKPQVIFTTAYNEHALKAFDLNAVDYLLKPYTADRLQQAVNKVALTNNINTENDVYQKLPQLTTEPKSRLIIKDKGKINFVSIKDIKYLEGAQDYVKIYTVNGLYLKHITMQSIEDVLAPEGFIRTHRSFIVNPAFVNNIFLEDQKYNIMLVDKTIIPVSRNKQKDIKSKFLGQ